MRACVFPWCVVAAFSVGCVSGAGKLTPREEVPEGDLTPDPEDSGEAPNEEEPRALTATINDGPFMVWESTSISVAGEAVTSEVGVEGQLAYQSRDMSGDPVCDFVVSFTGAPSARCVFCDFAFDLVTTISSDRSAEGCSPDLRLALLEGESAWGGTIENPGLGWATRQVTAFEYDYGGARYSFTRTVEDAVFGIFDMSYGDPYGYYYYGGFYDYQIFAGSISQEFYYYRPGGRPYESSYSYDIGYSAFDGENLLWMVNSTSYAPVFAESYAACDGAMAFSDGGAVGRTDYYARGTLPCTYSWYGYGYYPYYYYGGSAQAYDGWQLDPSAGDTLTVEVDGDADEVGMSTRLWLNGPSECTEVLGLTQPCTTADGWCSVLAFSVADEGLHEIFVTQDAGCPTGQVDYKLRVQVDGR